MGAYEIGLCSWNLHLTDEAGLRGAMKRLGLSLGHLALGPIAALPEAEREKAVGAFLGSKLRLSAGMIAFEGEDYTNLRTIHATGGLVPDETYAVRMETAKACGRLAKAMGLTLVSTHAGFIPSRRDAGAFEKLQGRLGELADAFGAMGLKLLFETGQEDAGTLVDFLGALKRENVGVNFDPANMLLYGKGDPVAAIRTLAPFIKHVHAKDTKLHVPVPTDGDAWRGHEIPLGQGDANLAGVVAALREVKYAGPVVIEREAGEHRTQDILGGIAFLKGLGCYAVPLEG